MHILFFAPRFHTNQTPAVKALKAAGHTVSYLVLTVGKIEDHSFLTPTLVIMCRLWTLLEKIRPELRDPMKKMKWGIPNPCALWRELTHLQPHYVVFRGDPLRTVPNIILWAICLLRRLPIIIYTQDRIHGGNPSRGRRFSYWLFLKQLKTPWFSPVLGQREEGEWRAGMTYLPFSHEPRSDTSPVGTHGSVIRILTIGKMFPRKNHRLLVRALALLRDDFLFHLTIIGECSSSAHTQEMAKLRDCITDSGLDSQVEILLNLSPQEIHDCYDRSDLFVLASTEEPASVSNLEAMAHGLPVIISHTNGTACYTTDGYDGFIFRDNDLDSLTGALRRTLSACDLRLMGENALANVRENHSPEQYVKSFRTLCMTGRP